MFNYKKLPVEVVQQKIAAAMILLRHALQCAKIQYESGRKFVFGHPASATSWKLPEVKSMLELPGMHVVVFDQCMLGRAEVESPPDPHEKAYPTHDKFFEGGTSFSWMSM